MGATAGPKGAQADPKGGAADPKGAAAREKEAAPPEQPPPNPLQALGEGIKNLVTGIGNAINLGITGVLSGIGGLFKNLFGGGKGASDLPTDGQRVDIFSSKDDTSGKPPILYVNGAASDLEASRTEAQGLSDFLGRDVSLIHNATEAQKFDNPLAALGSTASDGMKDLEQLRNDFHGQGHNPAVDSLKRALNEQLDDPRYRGQQIEVAGYSQGGQIVARALREVRSDRIAALVAGGQSDQQAAAQVDRELARVDVLNISGALKRSDLPQAVGQYHAVSLPGDPVPDMLGDRSEDARDGQFDLRTLLIGLPLAMNADRHAPLSRILTSELNRSQLLDFVA